MWNMLYSLSDTARVWVSNKWTANVYTNLYFYSLLYL